MVLSRNPGAPSGPSPLTSGGPNAPVIGNPNTSAPPGGGGGGGGGLSAAQENAYQAILALLKQYGLESLAPALLGMFQDGLSEAEINLRIQDTDEYKTRFAANEQRRKNGLPVLSPAEYLSVERSYREIMSTAGLPYGFYDEPSDFEAWIANDVSPTEIQGRVRVASEALNSLDETALASFREFYSDGDIVAYMLDRERAVPILERQWRAAQITSAARSAGLDSEQALSERLADMGVDRGTAQQGFGTAAHLGETVGRLSQVYGGDYDQDEAVDEVFFGDSGARRTRKRLASQERAQFGGSSGAATQSLSTRKAGQV
ncbi:MAG TPA: hypothetical protein VFF10_02610 [Trueperaceae bacterium]|nr:hypothetical protein [Trueperaceae bacterium]